MTDVADRLACPQCLHSEFTREELVSAKHTWRVTPSIVEAGANGPVIVTSAEPLLEEYEQDDIAGVKPELICSACHASYPDAAQLVPVS